MTISSLRRANRSLLKLFRVGLAVVLAGCGTDSLTLPREGQPATLTIVSGDAQQGEVGKTLADSLVVSVTDSRERPVVEQEVSFHLAAGSVTSDRVVTDRNGKATFHWVLGTAAGSQELEVGIAASGELTLKVTFSAVASPGPVKAITDVSGNGQTAQVGSLLPEALVVLLVDAYGNPVPGARVVWQATDGNLSEGIVATDSLGMASVDWTLGPSVGSQAASARLQGSAVAPLTFNAMATQGPPPHLAVVTEPSSTAQSGVVFPRQPSVRLEDSYGNPIAQGGVAVTVAIGSGGGALGGTGTVSTNPFGVAQFTNLSITGTPGDRTLIFAAPGHTAATSAPITITVPAPSPGQSTVSASPSAVVAGGASTITVTALDNGGNPIAGLAVAISVTGSGNTVTQPSGLTDANGIATGTVSSTLAQAKTVSARIATVTVTQTASITVVPGPPAAGTTTATVPTGDVLQLTTITIQTRDAYGNLLAIGGYSGQLRVAITGANTANPNVIDNGDGTYSASYFPIFTGTDSVAITLSGTPINGSPFSSLVN